jgi:hypothetical protein
MEKYTVFVASPSDVKKERDILSDIIPEINQTHGAPLGYELELWRYEEQAYPSANKPQELINAIAKPYQIFIGIMWKRFGTPTLTAESGTEEEYNIAYEAWQKKQVADVMFYFCKKPFYPGSPEENDQMSKVLKFKNELNGKSLIWDYLNPNDFKDKIQKHLCLLMNNIIQQKKQPAAPKTKADEELIGILKELWVRMTPELQNYLSVPYNENRMKGDAGIQTRDLFAAIVTNPTPELQAIIKNIPAEALPKPLTGAIVNEPYIINEEPWLSHCIATSLKRMSKALPSNQQLTALDVFIDIARNGTGESVRLLREHNVTPERIAEILVNENLQVING